MTSAGYNLGSAYGNVIISTNVGDAMDQARQQFDTGIAGMSASIKAWGDSLTLMGAQLSVLMSPLSDAMGEAIDQALEFDKSMTNVSSVLGVAGDDLKAMSDEVLALGANSRQGAQAAANAMYDIAGGVADASTHMDILKTSLDVATAGSANLDGVVNALVKTMNIYSLGAEDAAHAGDVFTRTVGMGVGTADEFAAALPPVEALGKELGFTFDELGAYMAYMSTKSASVAEGGTALRGVFSKLMNPSKELGDAISAMGFASGKAMVDQLGLVGALNKIKEFGGGSFAGLITDQEAMVGAMALTAAGADEFFTTFADGIDGATAKAKELQMASPAAQLDLFKNAMNGLSIQVGRELIPVLGSMATAFQPIVLAITDFVMNNGDLVRILGAVIGGLSALGTGITGLGLALSLSAPLMTAFSAGLAVVTGPIGLVIAGITALGAAWATNFLGIRDLLQPVVDRISDTLSKIGTSIQSFVADIQEFGILDAIQGAFGLGQSGEGHGGESYIEGIIAVFLGAKGKATGAAREMAIQITQAISSVVVPITQAFQTVVAAFSNAIHAFGDFEDTISQGGSVIDGVIVTAEGVVRHFLLTLGLLNEGNWLEFKTNFRAALYGIVDAFNEIENIAYNAVLYFNTVRKAGGDLFDVLRNQIQTILPMILRFFGASEDTVSTLRVVFTMAVNAIETVFDTAREVIESFVEVVSLVADRVGALIGNFVRLLSSGIGFFEALGSEVRYFADTLVRYFGVSGDTATQIRDVLVSVVNTLEDTFTGAASIVEGVITRLADAFGYIGWFIDNIVGRGGSFTDFFTIFEDGSSHLGEFLEKLGMSDEAADALAATLVNGFTSIPGVIEGMFAAIQRVGTGFLTLGRYVVETVNAFILLRNQGSSVFDALETMIKFNLRGFLEFIGITGEAATHVQNVLIDVVGRVETAFSNISNVLSAVTDGISAFMLGLEANRNEDLGIFESLIQEINYFFGIDLNPVIDLFESFFTSVSTILTNIGNAFSAVLNGVKIFIGGFNAFRDSGLGVFESLRKEIDLFFGVFLRLAGMGGETTSGLQAWLTTAVTNIERLFNAASSVVNSVWTWLSGLGDKIGSIDLSGITQLIGPLYELASWLLSWGNPFWMTFMILKTMGVDFLALIEDVAAGITTFFDTLSGGGDLTDAFSAVFGADMVNGITSGVDTVTGAIQDFIDFLAGIWEFVSPALTNLGNWFINDVLPATESLILNGVIPALQSLADFLVGLWETVSPHLEALANWFLYDALPAVQTFISGTIIPAIEQFINVLTKIWNDVSPFLIRLADWFLNSVLPTILSYINGLVIPGIQAFIDILVSIWNTIAPTLEQLYNWFITDGLPLIMEALELGRQAVQTLIDVMVGIWNVVQPGIQLLQDGLNAMITWLIENIFTPFGNLIANIVTGFINIWTDIGTGIENLKTGLLAIVTWFDTTIVTPIKNLINGIISGFTGIWNAIQEPLNTFKTGIDNILGGITTAINNVMNALGIARQEQEEILNVTTQPIAAGMANMSSAQMKAMQDRAVVQQYQDAGMLVPDALKQGSVAQMRAYATGSEYIQQDGPAYLHKGEAVLTAEQNAARFNGDQKPSISIGAIYANSEAEGRAAMRGIKQEFEEWSTFNG